jgi:hypothetical protein
VVVQVFGGGYADSIASDDALTEQGEAEVVHHGRVVVGMQVGSVGMYEFASDHHVYVEIYRRSMIARYDVFEVRLVYRSYGFIMREPRLLDGALHGFLREVVAVLHDMVTGC